MIYGVEIHFFPKVKTLFIIVGIIPSKLHLCIIYSLWPTVNETWTTLHKIMLKIIVFGQIKKPSIMSKQIKQHNKD